MKMNEHSIRIFESIKTKHQRLKPGGVQMDIWTDG